MLLAHELHKVLPNGTVLLRQVSFSVRPGEFVALLGASGAGKTLTLRAVVGLTSLSGGDVRLTLESGSAASVTQAHGAGLRHLRRQMGTIFQGLQLIKRLTVLENVMVGRLGYISPWRSWLYGFTDAEARQAYAALERVGMEKFADRAAGTLSGGEMQRVAIARAVHQQPKLYLADEPIAALDPRNADAVMAMLQSLAKERLVLGAFHQPEMVRRYCTRVIGLRDGAVVYDGSPALSRQDLRGIYGSEIAALGEAVTA